MSTVVGVPSEIKDNEKRVALTPTASWSWCTTVTRSSCRPGPVTGPGSPTTSTPAVGGKIVPIADEVFDAADLIVKVKEPVPAEYHRFRPGQQLFTYLHLAADRGLTEFLLERRIDSIAYETVQTADGKLPLLTPMSEVAGRMAVQAAAHHLENPRRVGPALLLGGVPGTPAAKVLIIGGGVVRHRGGEDRVGDAGHRPGPRHEPEPAGLPVRHLRRPAGPGDAQPGPDRPPTSPRRTS